MKLSGSVGKAKHRVGPSSIIGAIAGSALEETGRVTINYSNGVSEIRSGGSRSWRNNNPGNIIDSAYARRHGAIGKAGGFAVFPDHTAGQNALSHLLGTSGYRSLSLEAAMNRYAPPHENATHSYIDFLQRETGIDKSKLLRHLSEAEMMQLISAIEKFEGWLPGIIRYLR